MYTSIAGISIEPTSMTGSTPYSSSGGRDRLGQDDGRRRGVVVVVVVEVLVDVVVDVLVDVRM